MKLFTVLLIISIFPIISFAQDEQFAPGRLTGNFQVEAQTYAKDSIIGAPEVPENLLSNSFLNLNYTMGNFDFGMRYEAYLNPLLGIDARYAGQGISYRYATYRSDIVEITAGNFYEQFGSGLIFRAYEERALGLDNMMDGVRFKFRPHQAIEIKGIIGKQRNFWSLGAGIVRGGDINISINDLFSNPISENWEYAIGGSVVSKFQEDGSSFYILPENVFSYSARLNISSFDYTFGAEYAYKINDPNITNGFNYNPGEGIILNAAIFKEGFSASVDAHWIDNMDFRSDRDATGTMLTLGFIPPLTKQHAFRMATVYPFATQFNGEAGIQAEASYLIPKKSVLGGKYGTQFNINISRVHEVERTPIDEFTYETSMFSFSDRLYFQDFNFDITRKINKKLKLHLNYLNFIYDKDIVENEGSPKYGKVYANVFIFQGIYNITPTNAINFEVEHLWAKQDSVIHTPDNMNGNWIMFLAEYTIAPHFFITAWDEYNYGNDDEARQIHYLNASFAYIFGTSRIQVSYGKQRGGVVCVGGICRPVPASNGFYLSLSSSF